MEYIEDNTLMFMDIAKDEKGREAIEYGYETQNEYKDHLIRSVFTRDEQRTLDLLLIELMEEFISESFRKYMIGESISDMARKLIEKAIQ